MSKLYWIEWQIKIFEWIKRINLLYMNNTLNHCTDLSLILSSGVGDFVKYKEESNSIDRNEYQKRQQVLYQHNPSVYLILFIHSVNICDLNQRLSNFMQHWVKHWSIELWFYWYSVIQLHIMSIAIISANKSETSCGLYLCRIHRTKLSNS